MNSSKKKAIAGIASIILGATFLPLMFTSPASGATNNGTATLTQSSGTGATNFTINLGGSASCPGDGNAGYRWQTFMIPAAADIDTTLTFGGSGPTAVPSEFRQPLFDTTGSPVVSKLPDIAVAPATTGGISGIPNFNFQVFAPGDIPNGTYKIGVACTEGVASPTQLKSYWSQQITITNDPTNTDNAQIDWTVSAPVSTTTTTAAPTTTTTTAPTTTTTTAPPTSTPSFTAVSPARVFDTRPGEGGLRTVSKQKISGATELRVKLTDLSGLVPASGVGAVSLNVTVTQPDGAGYVTVYPCGTKPNASSLNYTAGQTIPNAVIAPVSAQGEVCFFSTQPTHILADVNGWFASGSSFTSVSPSRVFDTRPGEGGLRTVSKQKISGATELRVKLTNLSGLVPASGVGAVSLNVTVTQPDGAGYVTVYPCGTKPNASSLNYVAGETIPNAVIAPVSAQGEVCFFSTQPTHILADVNGWFSN
jgi:3,4-dihydroxy-2-butanone 4-phosphate synthase